MPREGRVLTEDLAVRFALTAVTHSSRDDPTYHVVSLSSVGVDHGERNAIGDSEGNDPLLARVLAVVQTLAGGASKINAAKAKSKLRSRRFASLFAGSHVKYTR